MNNHLSSPDDKLETQPFSEFESTVEAFFSKRGVVDNWVVGRGFILKPPFTLNISEGATRHTLVLTGKDENDAPKRVHIEARRAVTGRFRSQITFVTLDEVDRTSFKRLAPFQPLRVKLISGIEPGESISKAEFDSLTARIKKKKDGRPMSDGPRRWRELRSEYGFDVDVIEGRYTRGRKPVPVYEPQPRPDMDKLKKAMLDVLLPPNGTKSTPLFEAEEITEPNCNKCGRLIAFEEDKDGFPGVIDHRRPVLFGGGDERENLQLFCQQCNNLKAHICNRCPLSYHCERCTWAYPEKFHDTLVISLEADEATSLELLSDRESIRANDYAKRVLLKHLESET